ncbi:MAG: N-acetyltransferase [Bacillota bacterium]|nr:MAG: N-acetyltransferase [Bacillota bacterium]
MRHTGTIVLDTDRLRLRRFTVDDAEKMFENWAGNPEVTKYLPWKFYADCNGVKRYLAELEEKYKAPDFYDWCIEWRENGEPIGSVGAVQICERLSSVGVGYCLSEKYWGKGVVPEALNAVLKHFFVTLGAVRVTGAHFVENAKSGKVLKKCGFTEEGVLRKGAMNNEGAFVDAKLYSITDDEYFKRGK